MAKQADAVLSVVLSTFLPLAAMADDIVSLTLTPNLCVLTDAQPQCHINVAIEYPQPLSENSCLWRTDSSEPLSCFDAYNTIQLQLWLTVDHNVQFQLVGAESQLIAQAELTAARFDPAKTRRRRGLGWNL